MQGNGRRFIGYYLLALQHPVIRRESLMYNKQLPVRILVSTLLLLGLAGCGKKEAPATDSGTTSAPMEQAAPAAEQAAEATSDAAEAAVDAADTAADAAVDAADAADAASESADSAAAAMDEAADAAADAADAAGAAADSAMDAMKDMTPPVPAPES
jgi:hypothetical protein